MSIDVIVGMIGVIAAVLFGYIAYLNSKEKVDKKEGEQDGKVFTELGYIRSGIDDIKHQQEKQADQQLEIVDRLSTVESSVKQAHKRIDNISTKKG